MKVTTGALRAADLYLQGDENNRTIHYNTPNVMMLAELIDSEMNSQGLLTACEVAETVLSDIFNRESKSSWHGQRVRADIDKNLEYIRDVIAKATGGEQ